MEDNTVKTLQGIFKNVYNDKPVEALKQPREKSRRFHKIGKRLKKSQAALGINTSFDYGK